MLVKCSRKDLYEALSFVGPVSTGRTASPILGCIKLNVGPSVIELTSCDGELWARRDIYGTVETEGGVCVPGKLFIDIITALPEGLITLECQNHTLYIHQHGADWKIHTLPIDDFPDIPSQEYQANLTIPMGEFLQTIERVIYAVASDITRPILTGVLFEYNGSKLNLVATDSHRLAVVKYEKEGLGSDIKAVVPEKALQTIKRLPLNQEQNILLSFNESRVFVDAGCAKVTAQLLAGEFPNWERAVPEKFERSWVLDKHELSDHLKRVLIIGRDNANRVRFSGDSEAIFMSAHCDEKGEAKEEVPAITKNGDVEIAFNGKFLLEALNGIHEEGVKIELNDSAKAALIHGVEDTSYFCILMPMSLGAGSH